MFVHAFRSLHARLDATGLGAAFAPRKPRNPLLRLLLALVGLALLALLLVAGLAIGSLMLAAGLLRRMFKPAAARPVADTRVVDGEFRVVRKPVLPLSR